MTASAEMNPGVDWRIVLADDTVIEAKRGRSSEAPTARQASVKITEGVGVTISWKDSKIVTKIPWTAILRIDIRDPRTAREAE